MKHVVLRLNQTQPPAASGLPSAEDRGAPGLPLGQGPEQTSLTREPGPAGESGGSSSPPEPPPLQPRLASLPTARAGSPPPASRPGPVTTAISAADGPLSSWHSPQPGSNLPPPLQLSPPQSEGLEEPVLLVAQGKPPRCLMSPTEATRSIPVGEQRGAITRGLEGEPPRQQGVLGKGVGRTYGVLAGCWGAPGGLRRWGSAPDWALSGRGHLGNPRPGAPGWLSRYSVRLLILGS